MATSDSCSEPEVKSVGPYVVAYSIGGVPNVKCLTFYLGRKMETQEYFVIKTLMLETKAEERTIDEIQGKSLIMTEYKLSLLLQNEPGFVHEHGLIKEKVRDPVVAPDGTISWREWNIESLVLDCYVAHDFHPAYTSITNLQHYVIKKKRLAQSEALPLFYKVLERVERLHMMNIVHRDIKLGNVILDTNTMTVTLANLMLGARLSSENHLLTDQRGSPAYISPQILSGQPYLGKPADMWALGVTLFTMIYGIFPFYDYDPQKLFQMVRLGRFEIPINGANIDPKTVQLIFSLLTQAESQRPTVSQALAQVKEIISAEQRFFKRLRPTGCPRVSQVKHPIVYHWAYINQLKQKYCG